MAFCSLELTTPGDGKAFRTSFCQNKLKLNSNNSRALTQSRRSFVVRANKRSLVLPGDEYYSHLQEAALSEEGQDQLSDIRKGKFDGPPLIDIAMSNMAVQGARAQANYGRGRGFRRTSPPDLPSIMLDCRVIYIGMPLVPAVTELLIAQAYYLKEQDSNAPIYLYINSSGTNRADGETVAMESEGFALYDVIQAIKSDILTVGVGIAIGHACLLLASGLKGQRYMMPHATAVIQQHRLPSTGQMRASSVLTSAREAATNRFNLVRLLAQHTGQPIELVDQKIKRSYNMDAKEAIKFGVADKILWRGSRELGQKAMTASEYDAQLKAGAMNVRKPSPVMK